MLWVFFLIANIVPNNVKGNDTMGLFDKFKKKSKLSIDEASSLVSALLYESSINGAQLMQDVISENKKEMPEEVFWETVLEFQFLFLHITDRIAFGTMGNEKRSQFMDSLIEKISQHTIDNAYNQPSSSKTPRVEKILSGYFDQLNQRNVQYANYQKLFPDGKESPLGTLFWEFGKILSSLVTGSESFFIVHASNKFSYKVLKTINLKEIIEQIK